MRATILDIGAESTECERNSALMDIMTPLKSKYFGPCAKIIQYEDYPELLNISGSRKGKILTCE
jgi:hypothetical protein